MGQAMPSPESVSTLIKYLQSGNHEMAQPLWERYYPRLVGLARERLRGTSRRFADEEDVALSAFNSFCRGVEEGRFPQLKDHDGLWALLVLITVRKAADLAQYNRRERRGGGQVRGDSAWAGRDSDAGAGGLDGIADGDPTPAVAVQLAEELQHLLDRLGSDELRWIAVGKLEGYTNAEIAARLGCAEVSIERRLRLIRKILSDN
jgi:DNA-directed RNA polymerase specialized sigma24 family protein